MANGLINYGLLDPKLSSSFSTGYKEAEENRVQSEASQIKLDQLKQDRQMMTQFQQQLRSMGKNPDLGVIFDALIATGKPEYVAQGVEGHRRLSAQKEFAKIQDVGPEPAPPPMMAQPPINALAPPNALGSGTFGMEPTNALAAPPAAPVNALAAQPNQIAQTQNQIKKLMQFAASNPEMSTQAMAQARILQDQLELYSRRGQAESPDAVIMQRLGYPLTPEGFRAYNEAKRAPPPAAKIIGNVNPSDYTPVSVAKFNTSGNYGDLVLKPVDRAPVQPVAPTVTQIVDPTNANQMITIDARRYQGGGAGSLGVIGVAGKEPGAALRQNKVETGKTQLADDLDNLRASFRTLDEMRAIPSTERNVLSNLGSATAATGVGQMFGRAGGTEAQVERDVINSARMRLVNSIKNATGMSAQQLNSNVELQTMLKSISDPGQSVQAAMRIIDDIEEAYVKGDGKLRKSGKVTPAAAAGQNALSPAEQTELDQLRKRFGGK